MGTSKVEEAKELEGQAVMSEHHSFGGRVEGAGQGRTSALGLRWSFLPLPMSWN